MRTAEFDAFGPWVMQVVSPEGLPRLFADHPFDFDAARMILKVPRNIPRREANPDMHLYDHLIVAGESGLEVLSRHDDTYDASVLPYSRVAAVHTSVVILDGLLQVYDVEGPAPDGVALALPYNGVSDDVVGNLARIIRQQALVTAGEHHTVRPPGDRLRLGLDDLGRHDVALVSAERELAAAEDLSVWATHTRVTVRRLGGVIAAAKNLLLPATLHAAVVGSTSGEVHVVHRRPWFTAGRKPMHSVAHTVVTVPRVEHVEVVDHPGYEDVQVVTAVAGQARIEIPCPAGAGTVATLLALLGARVS